MLQMLKGEWLFRDIFTGTWNSDHKIVSLYPVFQACISIHIEGQNAGSL